MRIPFEFDVPDWYGLHGGFRLSVQPGRTAIVGPNGAGKTTLLQQAEDAARDARMKVFKYSNLADGGDAAMQASLLRGDMSLLATAASSSEGEKVALNFGQAVGRIGKAVAESTKDGVPLLVLLDGLDSGASIDRLRELSSLFGLIERDATNRAGGSHRVYILDAVNQYELAKGRCVDARTGKEIRFGSYDEYADFITGYFDAHQAKPAKKRRRKDP